MAYTKTTWVDGITPLSAANFNHMETGIADAHDGIASCEQSINGIMKLRVVRLTPSSASLGSGSGATLTCPKPFVGFNPDNVVAIGKNRLYLNYNAGGTSSTIPAYISPLTVARSGDSNNVVVWCVAPPPSDLQGWNTGNLLGEDSWLNVLYAETVIS